MADINDDFYDDELETITLEFDDGEIVECEPLFVFEYEGHEYISLIPLEENSEDVYLYEYFEVGEDEFEFAEIEDDELFDKVAEEFDRIIEEADTGFDD